MTQYVHIKYLTSIEGGTFVKCLFEGKVRVPKHCGPFAKQLTRRVVINDWLVHAFIDDRGFRWDCINGWTGLRDFPDE